MEGNERLFDISGKVALVSGSSRGLGLCFARGLARAGARVVLNGRDQSTLDKAVKELADEGCRVSGAVFDLGDSKAVAAGVARIESEIGGIEILVNNAGIQRRNPLETFPEEDFRNLIDINLVSPFVLSKAVVPGMIRRKAGKIINICSLMSEVGRPGITPYAASKGGLKMLTRGMALEWAKHGIQVNGIGPGYFKTEMNQALVKDADFDRWICGRTPAGRWGEPEELIGALLFLSSPASSFVNGQILYVDGGILAAL